MQNERKNGGTQENGRRRCYEKQQKKAEKLARKTEKYYESLGAKIKIIAYEIVGRDERYIFDVKLKRGTREHMIFDRASDVQIALRLPLFQPFKENLTIRIAASERPVKENSLRKMLTSPAFSKCTKGIPLALGYTVRGEMYFTDLAELKHALYGGSTGSGKSVGLQCLVMSIIAKQPVTSVNLLLFDIGANTLTLFDGVPHLSHPIVKDAETGISVMEALVRELERRIALDPKELQALPSIVCVVDEYVSFVSNISDKKAAKSLTDAISNLLRRGRHARIHIILATQDPKTKNMMVDLGNITARMAFACAKFHNSVTILGESGAEKLPGKGAMLFKSPTHPDPLYLQGAFMSSEEISRVLQRINEQSLDRSNIFLITEYDASQLPVGEAGVLIPRTSYTNRELANIMIWALEREDVSANQIQKKFRMSNRADDVMDELERLGIVEAKFANLARKVIPKRFEDLSAEVVDFLNGNGYTDDQIRDAFQPVTQPIICEVK